MDAPVTSALVARSRACQVLLPVLCTSTFLQISYYSGFYISRHVVICVHLLNYCTQINVTQVRKHLSIGTTEYKIN